MTPPADERERLLSGHGGRLRRADCSRVEGGRFRSSWADHERRARDPSSDRNAVLRSNPEPSPRRPDPWWIVGRIGAAVAAGMLPVAHGNDSAGSIRIPASCCGLVGLKPSRRLLGRRDPTDSFTASDGVLTRTVGDTAFVLDALASPQVRSERRSFVESSLHDPARLSVAVSVDPPLDTVVDGACVQAARRTGEGRSLPRERVSGTHAPAWAACSRYGCSRLRGSASALLRERPPLLKLREHFLVGLQPRRRLAVVERRELDLPQRPGISCETPELAQVCG
jgi:hypothetical protein